MIKEIERFQTLVSIGSVTRAARKLGITQPALTQSIKRLELSLGYNLFTLKQKKLLLTIRGEKFYRISQKIVDLWKKAVEIENDSKEIISIGLFDNAAQRLAGFLGKIISSLQTSLEVKIDKSKLLLQDLTYGLINIAVCVIDPSLDTPNDVICIKVLEEKLLPVASKKLDLPIEAIPFILYNPLSTTRSYIDKAFAMHELIPTIAAQSTSPSFMKELAISGAGVAILPENLVREEIKKKKLSIQNMPIKFSRKIGVFIKNEDKENNQIKNLVEQIIKNLTATN